MRETTALLNEVRESSFCSCEMFFSAGEDLLGHISYSARVADWPFVYHTNLPSSTVSLGRVGRNASRLVKGAHSNTNGHAHQRDICRLAQSI